MVDAGNVALNLAGAAVLLTRDRADLAALSFGVDTLVGEIQIWSRPWGAEQDWDNYRSMVAAGRATGARRPASWSLVPPGRGISFVAQF